MEVPVLSTNIHLQSQYDKNINAKVVAQSLIPLLVYCLNIFSFLPSALFPHLACFKTSVPNFITSYYKQIFYVLLHFHRQCVKCSRFLQVLMNICYYLSLLAAILVAVKWCLSVVYISLGLVPMS